MKANDLLEIRFKDGLAFLMAQGKRELSLQGHRVTGALERSFESVVIFSLNKVIGRILVEDYGLKLNEVQKPETLGSFSDHYKNLVSWAANVKPELTPTEQRSFAYRTAANHFSFGIPLAGAFAFSENGRRTGWIKFSLEDETNLNTLFEILDIESIIEIAFNEMVSELQTLKIAA